MCAVLYAAEAAVAGAGKDFYPGDLGQAIAAILIFGLLLLVLGKWAWGPIVRQLQDREQDIITTIESAKRREEEARSLAEEYKGRIENAEAEGEKIIARSRRDSEIEGEKIIDAARREADDSVQDGLAEIQRARRQAIREMRDATAQLAADIAGRVIEDSLTPQMHDELVDASIKAIGQRTAEDL